MSYDINAIKKRIQELSEQNKRMAKRKGGGSKLTYFKPTMGPNNIRFLPYDDGEGQPFQRINYYDNKKIAERRIVAPVQWGKPDPVADLVEELEKDRANDTTWNLLKGLRMKESNYALVYVRGQEDKGVQVWELNRTVLQQIYTILAHPDYVDDDLFHPEHGFDFTVTCTDSGKRIDFKGKSYPVKNYDVQVRRKPSPVIEDEDEREKLLESIPNLSEHFEQYCMGEEKLQAAVRNFLAEEGAGEDDVTHTEDDFDNDEVEEETSSKIDAAFADLD